MTPAACKNSRCHSTSSARNSGFRWSAGGRQTSTPKWTQRLMR
ncbi:CxxxxCH/CxxCH domain-containing protein [Arthrobacter sp. KBS0703]|nr:CxxxxCH/CxxCH domain-containing protein [Arthrobacter sp. KBS0703]